MPDITQSHYIEITQLRVGLYIHLDLGWMDHSFTFSNFKIKDEDQIAKIKKIGLKKLRYDPKRSDCEPAPLDIRNKPNADAGTRRPVPEETELPDIARDGTSDTADALSHAEMELARQRQYAQRLHLLHRAFDESERQFLTATQESRIALKNILSQPGKSVEQGQAVVNGLLECALNESEVAIHAINGNRSGDSDFVHSLNVTVLAMMMARSLEMSETESRTLGMAALFHDIGKAEVPGKILLKKEALTKSEQSYYEQHSELGAQIAKKSGMSDHVARIIMQHHEHADGSGYPKHLKAEQTDPLARLVSLLNCYDNLCNPQNIALAKTPYEALAYMFGHQRTKFDEDLLKRLIKSLGIYPPGSIVQLSNGIHGVVVSVNPNKPLRPFVMLHDSVVDRNVPLILDLREEPSINISICMKPAQLPQDALDYLNPRKRINYFIDKDYNNA